MNDDNDNTEEWMNNTWTYDLLKYYGYIMPTISITIKIQNNDAQDGLALKQAKSQRASET